ncbi:hypothetical protein [Allokutzneria albata]|uniref:Uncharacterized protein n=1 Tax=Allokutzneria albata TaxID=211114 RepID=A0A1H0DWF8_ALLAB|nr:hypothetical protein [Allokutzneria albata]SDN74492.1 hypothetical protein SAMN04489726_8033 [Allokutzneria albata]
MGERGEHQEGHEVEAISLAEPSPTTPTLCGYATVDGVRYEIHYSRSGRDTVRTEWDLLPTTSGVEYLPVRVEKRWIGGPCLYSIALAPVPAADEPRQRLAEGEHADDCDLTCTAEGQIPCWVYEIAPTEEADRG